MRAPHGLLIVAALTIFNSCGSSTAQSSQKKNIIITGTISNSTAEKVIPYIRDGINIIINSQGGEIKAAIRIGEVIRKKDVDIVVDGICLSACAHFILPFGRNIFIKENSVVGYHGTSSGVLDLLNKNLVTPTLALSRMADIEQKLYAEYNISNVLLIEPIKYLEPRCFLLTKDSDGRVIDTVAHKISFLVPSRKALSGLINKDINGYWPDSPQDLDRTIKLKRPMLRGSFLFVSDLKEMAPKPVGKISSCN